MIRRPGTGFSKADADYKRGILIANNTVKKIRRNIRERDYFGRRQRYEAVSVD